MSLACPLNGGAYKLSDPFRPIARQQGTPLWLAEWMLLPTASPIKSSQAHLAEAISGSMSDSPIRLAAKVSLRLRTRKCAATMARRRAMTGHLSPSDHRGALVDARY